MSPSWLGDDASFAFSEEMQRVPTFTYLEDHTIVDGWDLRFANPDVERAYRQVGSEKTRGMLFSMWIVFSLLYITFAAVTTAMEPWDYTSLPTSAWVVLVARGTLVVLTQVPLVLWKLSSSMSPEAMEWTLYAASFVAYVLLGGLTNYWRVGWTLHGDGYYLYNYVNAAYEPSETLFVACFYCASMFYSKVPLLRASRAWIHLLATYVLFIGLLLTPGLSPETVYSSGVVAVLVGFYYHGIFVGLFKTEKANRVSWAHTRRLEAERRELYEAEQSRKRGMIQSVHESHKRQLMKALEKAVESEQPDAIMAAKNNLLASMWTVPDLQIKELEIRKKQSEERGVTLSYLLSDEFEQLAREKSGLEDPTFHDLVQPFFLGPGAIGRDRICPRDGRRGCALVDSLPRQYRRRCTHFLSWTWSSRLSTVREALKRWADRNGSDPDEVAFYMCFFVNNQYRILVPGADARGSDSLGKTFERNLLRTKRMVALLDTFDKPTYLTRIWTIFEQFTAMRLGVEVEITLPSESRDALIKEFERGKEGIMRVRDAVSTVDSSSARASDPADELQVKREVSESVGFEEVDKAIKRIMSEWVANELRTHMDEIIHDGNGSECSDAPAGAHADSRSRSREAPTLFASLFSRAEVHHRCQATCADEVVP
jgi:hypothetical protein